MGKLQALTSCLLLTVAAVTAQTARAGSDRLLPQWLTGIIAVSIFLFLAFVVFLVKRAWCEQPSRSAADGAMTPNKHNATKGTGSQTADETYEAYDTTYETTYDTTLDLSRKKTSTKSRTNEDLYETTLDLVRSKEDTHAYDNLAMGSSADKVTSM